MARATLATVKRMVMDNLGVSTTYGTYASNERYPEDLIDDKIAEADISIVNTLITRKQDIFLRELYSTQSGLTSGSTDIDSNWVIISLTLDGDVAEEIPFGQFEKIDEGGIFDKATYTGYYSIKNGKLYFIGTTPVLTYIDLTHPSTLSSLSSPSGFEGAVANRATASLLMKRMDKPQEAEFYMKLFTDFMSRKLAPEISFPVTGDD